MAQWLKEKNLKRNNMKKYLLQRKNIGVSRIKPLYDYFIISLDTEPVLSGGLLSTDALKAVSGISGIPELTRDLLECENGVFAIWSVIATDQEATRIAELFETKKKVALELEALGLHPESETLLGL